MARHQSAIMNWSQYLAARFVVMGLMMFGFAGGLPFGAMTSSILAGQVGPQRTMTIVGLAAMALCIPLTWRRIIIRQR